MTPYRVLLVALLLGGPAGLVAQSGIAWTPSFPAALEKARAENKPIFVAINMDGERANDEMANDVYKDSALVELSKQTVNLFCSKDDHGAKCTRVAGIGCEDHKKCEIAVRERILGKKEGEPVVAPQHLFLAPDGSVISSVAYRVTKAELEWMWVAAIKKLNPAATVQPTQRAKAPHELVVGDKPHAEIKEAPPTKEEVDAALKKLKKSGGRGGGMRGGGKEGGGGWGAALETMRLITRSPDPEALQWGETAMRGIPEDRKADFLEAIGRNSPKEWWEIVASHLESRSLEVRKAAAIALERLAEPKSLQALQGRVAKETDPYLKGRVLRAMAAVAPANKSVAAELQRIAKSEKDELVRAQAFIAAGALEDKAAAATLVNLGLQDKSVKGRGGAAYAVAVRRDKDLLPPLEFAAKAETEEKAVKLFDAAKQAVEKGAQLTPFKEFLKTEIGDKEDKLGKPPEKRSAALDRRREVARHPHRQRKV
jgi:hypothetical protein